MTWEWYQARIAEFFRRIPGADVEEDIEIEGNSKTRRQIDVWVTLPVKVQLGWALEVPVKISMMVDAKKHTRPVGIGVIEQIDGAREDVNAHIAIIASPIGFTDGARERAKICRVIPLTATSDLLGMLNSGVVPWGEDCLADCDPVRGLIAWRADERQGTTRFGWCANCGTLHMLCADCGFVSGITEAEYEEPLRCGGDCGRVYMVKVSEAMDIDVESHDQLDELLLTAAAKNTTKRITAERVQKIIQKTKWQYFKMGESPTINLTETELMEWSGDGAYLSITPAGEKILTDIRTARNPILFGA